jgi:hypothetical protein
VVATEREVVYETDEPSIRVRYRRSEAPPPYTYAVTVEAEIGEGLWTTVRLWDNADDVHEHHVHEYTREEGKQKPLIRAFASINAAIATAISEAREDPSEVVRQWRNS